MINMIRKARIDIAKRLFHIDIFIKSVIKEVIFDFKLMNWPLVGDNRRKNDKNNSSLDNMTKGISVVKTKYLRITLCEKICH
jgi:hypothetical protein